MIRPRVPQILGLLGLSAVAAALLCPVPSRAADTHETQLKAAKGSAESKFGTAVSISGDTAVVSAPDEGGTAREGGMGAVYVFTRSDGAWAERATLVAPVRRDGDKFGFGVAIDRDTIVVGAPNAEELAPGPGLAYVFVRRGQAWAHQATLKPSERRPDDAFGFAVALSGDTAVIGAKGSNVGVTADPGAAYVFTRTGDVWREQAKLTASDGAPADLFGGSVALWGDTAIIGAVYGDVGARIDHGSAYVFTRTGSRWTEQAKLAPSDGTPRQAFGDSVKVFGDTVVVGAPEAHVGVAPVQGSAFVFVRNGNSWTQQAKLTAPAPAGDAGDFFGRSVDTTGDAVVVGAHFDEGGGGVYVFNRTAGAWSAPTRHIAAGAELLGVSIAVSGHTVVAGANFTKVGNNGSQGAAYVYRVRRP